MRGHRTSVRTRRVVAAVVAGLLVALSAGCGGGGKDQTLRVWFPGNLSNEITWVKNEAVPAFEAKHPGVDVQVEFVDWDKLSTRLSTAFAGGTAPDVFGHGTAATAGFATAGRVSRLDGYLDTLPDKDVDDLAFLPEGKVGDSHYFMPLRGFGYLLAYREDMFKQAGLDPKKPAKNWRQLHAHAKRLTERKGDDINRAGLVLSAGDPTSMSQSFGIFLFQSGGEFLSAKGDRITWNSTRGKEALRFLTDLYQGDEPVANGLGQQTNGAGAQHPLVTGQAAMGMLNDETLKTIHEQAPDVAEKITVAPPLDNGETASFGGAGNGLFLSADSKQKKTAWQFIEFMTNKKNAKAYVEVVGGIPARTSLLDDPDLRQNAYLRPYMESAGRFHGNPNVATWTQLRDILAAEIEQALRGKKKPDKALDDAATKAGKTLREDG